MQDEHIHVFVGPSEEERRYCKVCDTPVEKIPIRELLIA